MQSTRRLILASGSPRRRDLLRAAGIAFDVVESKIPEFRAPGEGAREYAQRLARAKALAVAARDESALVIGADTVVECQGEILEKPCDGADAARMLKLLSGRKHTVVTAFAIACGGKIIEADAVASIVTFRRLSEPEIAAYILSGDPFDKAGAYGIQSGTGSTFIAAVNGPRDNVMGLPVESVIAALKRAGFNV